MLNREERTAVDGEATKEAFCPSLSLLLILHAFSIHFHLLHSLPFSASPLHALVSPLLSLTIFVSPFIILSHFPQLSVSPPITSSSCCSLLHSSLPLYSFRSCRALCWNQICHRSLETDRVGLPGVSTRQNSKTVLNQLNQPLFEPLPKSEQCVCVCVWYVILWMWISACLYVD